MSDPRTHPGLQPETATDCYLKVRGWEPSRVGLKPHHEATFYFIITEAMKVWGVQMAYENMNTFFNACRHIEFEVKSFSGKDVVLLLDNVFYRTYNVTSWWDPEPGVKQLRHDGPYGVAIVRSG